MICKICGKEFDTSRGLGGHISQYHHITRQEYYDLYQKQPADGICVVCGKSTSWDRTKYKETCSVSCAAKNPARQAKIKKTNLAKYGVDNVYKIQSVKQHSIEAIKQGKRNYKCLCCGKETGIKKFCSQICKDIYKQSGGSYNNRNQAKQTCIEQFNGKMNSGAWPTRRNKIEQFEIEHNCTSTKKLIQKYGQAWRVLNLPKIMINKQNSAIDNKYLPIIEKFAYNYHISAHSSVEDIIYQDIKSFYNGIIMTNTRKIIHPLELDIYLPDLRLAIEFNGTYWHSTSQKADKNYHLNKSLLCRNKHIRLIHLYEFEPYSEQIDLIKQLILGIDKFPSNDFNKNNLIDTIPTPEIIYDDGKNIIYGAGKLY